ncbi:MAG: V0D/AC39 family V-type ATPase subunit [Lachnospiraceae bacterium]
MGNVIAYSGLSTKVKAMTSKFIDETDFQEIVQMTSVPQVVSYLKKTSGYQNSLASVDETTLHRGDIERLLKKTIFNDFSKLYHFSNLEQRKFLRLYFKRYEILFIKSCMRVTFSQDNEYIDDFSPYIEFFHHHTKLDIERLPQSKTIDELVSLLKGTDYYQPLSKLENRSRAMIFDYGMALDLHYFSHIWKAKDRFFSGEDLTVVKEAYGGKFDLINVQWIQRSKQYYHMLPADIYALLIPVYAKLKKEQVTSLVEAPTMEEFYELLSKTYYGQRYSEFELLTLEEFYNFLLRHLLESLSRKHPNSVAILYNYMYHKEHEIDRLTTAIECVRYGVEPEEAMSYIRKN